MNKSVVFVLGMLAGAGLLRVVLAQGTDFRALNHIGIVVENVGVDEVGHERRDLRRHGVAANDIALTPAQALYTRVRDPDRVEIEVMQFGPEASQRKAMQAWRGPSRP